MSRAGTGRTGRVRAVRALAVGAVVAVLGTACAAGGGPTPAATSDGELDRYFDEIFGAPSDPAQLAEQQREIQDAVAACMADEGFDYVPLGITSDDGDGPVDLPEWGSQEFAEQVGYGVTTLGSLLGDEEPEDPNQAMVEAMSDAERAAWETALYGERPEDEDAMALGGCFGDAQQELFGGGVLQDPTFQQLSAELVPLYERIDGDERVTVAVRAWSACMGEAGLDVDSPDAAVESIYAAAEDADESQLAALREREITLATADQRCQEQTGLPAAREQVQGELEQQFVAEHRTELESLAAASR